MNTSTDRRLGGAPCASILLLAAVLGGCATPDALHKDPSMEGWKSPEAAPESRREAMSELPPALTVRPMEPVALAKAVKDKALPTVRIGDLELTDEADVAMVLRTLAKAADVNMLVSPKVSGTVSLAFRDIPWDEAFRSVVSAAGLTYAWDGDVLRVMTLDDVKRNLEMETVLKQREDVRAEKRRIEPLAIQVIPIRYSRAKSIGTTVASLLETAAQGGPKDAAASPPRASVSVDEENNAIIVHAIREDIEKVVALVQQLDRAKPQVHIEARIVEASRDTARQLGVQWGMAMSRVGDGRLVTTGGGGATAGGYMSDFPAQFAQGLELSPVGFSLGMLSQKIGGSELLNMQLTALQSRGRIQILSSPSITTLDNEPAVIESGEERAYRKGTGSGINADITVEWKKAVLKLEVTPHVVDNDYLRVEIVANKDTFDETKPQANNEFPVNTKRASTTVLLRNGETVVIGGLSLESDSQIDSGIPLLMDIPGVGALFRNRGRSRRFDETLIFITPEIIAGR
jgi:type IV pilus assembly protein PilQ